MDASSKHSSSAATASLCFSHIQELWARLAWPDPTQAQALGTQLSQVCWPWVGKHDLGGDRSLEGQRDRGTQPASPEPSSPTAGPVCGHPLLHGAAAEEGGRPARGRGRGSERAGERAGGRGAGRGGQGAGPRDADPPPRGPPPQLCVVLNNVELLRKAAGQTLRGLARPEATAGPEAALPRPLLSCAQALDEDLQQEVHTVTAHLTSKVGGRVEAPAAPSQCRLVLSCAVPQMVADIRKYVQHISLSPDSIQNDEVRAWAPRGVGRGGPWGNVALRMLPAGRGPAHEVPG